MAVFVLVHGFLKHNWGYTSRIHQSALGVLVVPLAARGMVLLAAGVSSRVGRSEKSVAGILLAIVLVAGPVPKALKPNRGGRALERTVGEWIREDFGSGPLRVFGWESRVPAHYARARFSALPPGDPKSAIEAARRLGGDYVVIHLRSHGPLDEDLLPKLLVAGLKPAHSPFEARRDDVIYTWLVFRCQ
jgi:hypothetical protein